MGDKGAGKSGGKSGGAEPEEPPAPAPAPKKKGGGHDGSESANVSRFHVMSKTEAEEENFDLMMMRSGVRSGLWESLANLTKGAICTGILMAPDAYKVSGYVSGMGIQFLCGCLMCYNFYTLGTCAQRLCRRAQVPFMTYPDVGEAAFAMFPNPKVAWFSPYYRKFIDLILCCYLFSLCFHYQDELATRLKQMVELTQNRSLDGAPGYPGLKVYLAAMIIPNILICSITEIKNLAPFSLGANVIIICVLGILIFYAGKYGTGFSNMVACTTASKQLQFAGMSVFMLSCAGAVLPVENNMKDPNQFYIVIFAGYAIIFVTVLLASMLGHAAFVNETLSKHFPQPDTAAARMLLFFCALIIYVTHAVNFYNPFKCIFYYLSKKTPNRRKYKVEVLYRIIAVILVSLFSLLGMTKIGPHSTSPYENRSKHLLRTGIVPIFCLAHMAFICPSTIYVLVHYDRPGWGKYRWKVWVAVLMSIIGVLLLFAGEFGEIKREEIEEKKP